MDYSLNFYILRILNSHSEMHMNPSSVQAGTKLPIISVVTFHCTYYVPALLCLSLP